VEQLRDRLMFSNGVSQYRLMSFEFLVGRAYLSRIASNEVEVVRIARRIQ
jgi:hypothetical protein